MTIIDISGKTIAQRAEIFKPIGLKLDHTGVPKGLSLTFSPHSSCKNRNSRKYQCWSLFFYAWRKALC